MGGLSEQDWELIRQSLDQFPEIERVILFGSRALGNYKKGSDVDLAIVGDTITHRTLTGLHEWLNDVCPLPYMFDLLDYAAISHENLRQHIDTSGRDVYRRHS